MVTRQQNVGLQQVRFLRAWPQSMWACLPSGQPLELPTGFVEPGLLPSGDVRKF